MKEGAKAILATRTGPAMACPCGGKAWIGRASRPDGSGPVDALLHSVPYCLKFEQLTPDVFVSYVSGKSN